ncbi:major intrinsic protein (MIP) family transporter [Medicago truncatula]|uniref:Major intrinsic protein (MIP) family transporter n=1 Tax=Medicago truncatula TaxID=3880 RepID=A0A072TSH0_MEDTR|nr:major intrinsic protein (MIP) family transporter [Medicago truncatula]
MSGFGASILEGILTFVFVYTIYDAMDTRRGQVSSTGTLVIGLIAGACVLAAGPFSGGNQAVYWVGLLVGAAVAGLLYDNVLFPSQYSDSIRGVLDGTVRM